MPRPRRFLPTALLVAAAGAALAPWGVRAYWRWRESNPVSRGARLAARMGCLACHGPAGSGGLPDPGLGEEVPAWDGGVAMMYVEGADEVRQFIRDGTSVKRAHSESAQERRTRAAIRMPAYRDRLSAAEVEDLTAYVLAVARLDPIKDPVAARGRDLVAKYRCVSCHGVEGSGGVENPGSFKGYVPGWRGADFRELVWNDAELKDWILTGSIHRLEGNPLARFFLRRQRLKMPAYAKSLAADETEAIAAYVRSLAGGAS